MSAPTRSTSTPGRAPGRAPGRDPGRTRTARPLGFTAAVAGVGGALGGIVVLQAVALTGWFLADGGIHGTTTDALRVGAAGWLVGHGSGLALAGVHYTVVPLGLTLLLAWAAYRSGRAAGEWAACDPGAAPVDDRELVLGIGVLAACYTVVAVLTAVLAGASDAGVSLLRVVLGALVVSGLVGGAGVVVGSDRTDAVTGRLPAWVEPVVRGAVAMLVGLAVASAALVTVSFVLHLDAAMSLVSRLGLSSGDAVMLGVASAAFAPNAAGLGASYLLGPGFSLGTGTAISPTVVTLGPVPAFPLLAALPQDGPVPWWATATVAVPPLVALLTAVLVQRRHPVLDWDVAALRGAGSGVLAAVLVTLGCWLSGGALGDGRLAALGPAPLTLLVAACVALGLGGLVGALATTFVQRRRGSAADLEPTVVIAAPSDAPPRVVVGSRPDEPTVHLGPDAARPAVPGRPDARAPDGATPDGATPDEATRDDGTEDDAAWDATQEPGIRELRARFRAQLAHNDDGEGPTPVITPAPAPALADDRAAGEDEGPDEQTVRLA